MTVNWISTALVQIPLHQQLASDFQAAAHRRLVVSNWVRTAAGTAHSLIVLALVSRLGPEELGRG